MRLRTDTDTTIRIARILSLYLLVTGIGFLVSEAYYTKMFAHTGSDPVLINLSGMVHFFIGGAILSVHFKWGRVLEIVVSFLGLMFLIKGILLIALPEFTLQLNNNPVQIPKLMSAGFILAGCMIGFFSFYGKGGR